MEIPEGGQTTGEALVLYINRIRMFVCLSVCTQTPPREIDEYRCVIYESTQNLSGKDYFLVSSQSDQWFGRYWPKTRHRSKK